MFNVYGVGQNLARMDQGLVSIFTTLLIKSPKLEVKGSLNRYRDLINIEDIVSICFKLAEQDSFNGPINLGTGQKTKLSELITIIAGSLNLENKLEILEASGTPGDIFGIYGDISLLQQITNKKDFILPQEGVEKFVAWAIKENGKSAKIIKIQ